MTLTVPSFAGIRMLVAGDVMLDRYWFGPTIRVSPEAPVPVVRVDDIVERPGGAANVAVNLRSVGVTTRLQGITAGFFLAAVVILTLRLLWNLGALSIAPSDNAALPAVVEENEP